MKTSPTAIIATTPASPDQRTCAPPGSSLGYNKKSLFAFLRLLWTSQTLFQRQLRATPLPAKYQLDSMLLTEPQLSRVHPPGYRPIVWTIAGSDAGGGAGIQADLHAFQALGCHGCSVITALTAQNSLEVRSVHVPPLSFLQTTTSALMDDLPPAAIKTGMLPTSEVMEHVASICSTAKVALVCDPVLITTSGARLVDDSAMISLRTSLLPLVTLLTPNLHETEFLVGHPITSTQDMEKAALALLDLMNGGSSSEGPISKGVLIKGGHFGASGKEQEKGASLSQDYLLLADRNQEGGWDTCGLWLSSPRVDTDNTHGTGCTLSSAVASFLAQGLDLMDAVTMAKAYVTAGIRKSAMTPRVGKGPGPVQHTYLPSDPDCLPIITDNAQSAYKLSHSSSYTPIDKSSPMNLYACVDSAEWCEKLIKLGGVTDIQIRIKDRPAEDIDREIAKAASLCRQSQGGIRLWVNDYVDLALRHSAFGVHVGQEDLSGSSTRLALEQARAQGLALGISTHSYMELGRALAFKPSYISLGPIFPTTSKVVRFSSQGLWRVRHWRSLVAPHIPLVTIGGISLDTASGVLEAGGDSICVISALTSKKQEEALKETLEAWGRLPWRKTTTSYYSSPSS